MHNKLMRLDFTTLLEFKPSITESPVDYYLIEIGKILLETYENKKPENLRLEIDGGGAGGGIYGGYLWCADEYYEDNITKALVLCVTHDGMDISATLHVAVKQSGEYTYLSYETSGKLAHKCEEKVRTKINEWLSYGWISNLTDESLKDFEELSKIKE